MGNCTDNIGTIRNDGLDDYLRPGLTIEDLLNLKRAYLNLDEEKKGYIIYDVNKISDIGKYRDVVQIVDGRVKLTYEQFMEVMATNIMNNRKEFGKEKIKFESETNSAMCFVCPFENTEKENEYRPL